MAHVRVEIFPKPGVLAQGSVTRAGHVAQDSIESEISQSFAYFEVWEFACISVHNKESGQLEAACLMGQHVSPLCIHIISDNEAFTMHLVLFIHVKLFEDLDGFATWSRAHV